MYAVFLISFYIKSLNYLLNVVLYFLRCEDLHIIKMNVFRCFRITMLTLLELFPHFNYFTGRGEVQS